MKLFTVDSKTVCLETCLFYTYCVEFDSYLTEYTFTPTNIDPKNAITNVFCLEEISRKYNY